MSLLCSCAVLREEFWKPIIDMLIQTGMQAPTHYPAFLATGALDSTRVISYYHSGAWFIAWRCIYAEIVGSRIEDRAIDTEKALTRAVAMIIGRLKAYGGFWREWVNKSHNQRRPKQIPPKHREKRLMRQEADGEYTIHAALLALAESTQPTSSSNRRPT